MLGYQYFKDHYQLIAVDLSKQKELDDDPRAIRQIEFYGMLETNSQVYCLRKIKRNCIRILQRSSKSCNNLVEYNTVNAKLSDSQLNKLKGAVKNKQGTTLRMNAKMFSANNLPHELLLTTR